MSYRVSYRCVFSEKDCSTCNNGFIWWRCHGVFLGLINNKVLLLLPPTLIRWMTTAKQWSGEGRGQKPKSKFLWFIGGFNICILIDGNSKPNNSMKLCYEYWKSWGNELLIMQEQGKQALHYTVHKHLSGSNPGALIYAWTTMAC